MKFEEILQGLINGKLSLFNLPSIKQSTATLKLTKISSQRNLFTLSMQNIEQHSVFMIKLPHSSHRCSGCYSTILHSWTQSIMNQWNFGEINFDARTQNVIKLFPIMVYTVDGSLILKIISRSLQSFPQSIFTVKAISFPFFCMFARKKTLPYLLII